MYLKSSMALLLTLACGNALAQNEGVYEERPGFGLYAEVAHFSDMTFMYREKPKSDSGSLVASYDLANKSDFEWTPIVGVSGQLPFLFKNWLNLQATVGGMLMNYKLTSSDTLAVQQGVTSKELNSFVFVIQGGPEFGVPVIADEAKQTLLKPYIFGNILVGKAFNWDTHFTNDPYLGVTYGGGVRYAVKRLAFEAGLKGGNWLWKPTYDPAEGNIDASKGKDQVNEMRVVFYQNVSPYLALKFTTF